MDKKKSVMNVSISTIFKLITMLVAIAVRRSLILSCGNDVNGLNALYLGIIGFLAIAELGVGSAVSFCMYRPIVEGDTQKISALYHLLHRLYLLIGAVILIAGLVLTPVVHCFAKDYEQININLHSTFVLMLVSVAITYLFGADLSLINAHKNNYITTAINSGGLLLQYLMQIAALKLTGSFHAYLICRIVAALVQWLISWWVVKKKHGYILRAHPLIDAKTRTDLVKHIRAMFMHKVGGLLVNSTDSIVISIFSGVVTLGKYANYQTISGAMVSVIDQVFASLTSVFGHLYVQENRKVAQDHFETMHLLNFVLGDVFFLGYYAVIDDLVSVLFGTNLYISKLLLMVHTANCFVRYLRGAVLVFRDATGTFYQDRWKPLIEGTVNLILSVALASKIGVVGVIGATLLTNLFICHIAEPYVLYKYAFSASAKGYYVRNYVMIAAFILQMFMMDMFRIKGDGMWKGIVINGCISIMISLVTGVAAIISNRKLRHVLVQRIKGETK